MIRPSLRNERFDRLLGIYGEIIHDTCEALIPAANQPNAVFRAIARQIRKEGSSSGASFEKYERPWLFRIVTDKIRRYGRLDSIKDPEHQTLFSSEVSDPKSRLERTLNYLQRLPVDARISLFLSRRHGFQDSELAAILGVPKASLAVTTRQATETLRDWIWQNGEAPPEPETDTMITEALRKWTPKPLPEELKQTPLSHSPKASGERRSRWQRTPWYVRSGMEALALALVILAVVALVPKIRNIYERSLENQLSSFNLTEEDLANDPEADDALTPDSSALTNEPQGGDTENEELAETSESSKVTIAGALIWRFYIRTHSPADLRPLIVKAIQNTKIPPSTPGVEGVEAPGGIQFNLLIPAEFVHPLRNEIKNVVNSGPDGEPVPSGNFTWYVTKAKTRMPKGQSRVVIWVYRLM